MPNWSVYFEESARKDFHKLDKSIQIRITEKLDWFANHFEQVNPLWLSNDLVGFLKLRVGDYRVVYEIDLLNYKLNIAIIEHRSKVYKRKNI
jgi:mRNA interferase RelE/StbE